MGLVSRVNKQFLQLNNKDKQPNFKIGQRLNGYFYQENYKG